MTAVAMMTSELDARSRSIAPEPKTMSIVVASDGSESAFAAFKAATLIKARNNAEIHVLTVLEPMPAMFPSVEGIIIPVELDRSREEAQRTTVLEQMMPYDPASEWSLDIRLGRAAESIVDFAVESKADLIIVGLHRHGIVGRLLGEETAMAIARLSPVPLLVASPGMKRLPHRVMVAMDLRPDGLQCAPEALAAIANTPSISCVHVKPRSEFLGVDWVEFDRDYELAMRERFSALENQLDELHLRPDLIVLHGEASHELTDFAAYSKAELIVTGVRRRLGRARATGGRMAAKIIRHAECSVLVVPSLYSPDPKS